METSAHYRETLAQYREFAEECDRLAQEAKTEHQRTMAQSTRNKSDYQSTGGPRGKMTAMHLAN